MELQATGAATQLLLQHKPCDDDAPPRSQNTPDVKPVLTVSSVRPPAFEVAVALRPCEAVIGDSHPETNPLKSATTTVAPAYTSIMFGVSYGSRHRASKALCCEPLWATPASRAQQPFVTGNNTPTQLWLSTTVGDTYSQVMITPHTYGCQPLDTTGDNGATIRAAAGVYANTIHVCRVLFNKKCPSSAANAYGFSG